MISTVGAIAVVLSCAHLAVLATPAGPMLGHPASDIEIAAHDTMIFPDGAGLPSGSGSVAAGEVLFRRQCMTCHGERGIGGSGGELAGGKAALTSATPDQNIGMYWPYATTLFDFIRRAMPMTAPGSLSANEVYALTAYLLYENGIVPADATLDQHQLSKIRMPNRDGFIWIDVQAQDAPP